MNEEILRIKKDLEIITAAAGLEKPTMDRRSLLIWAWILCLNGLLALILAVCALLEGVHLPWDFIWVSAGILALAELGGAQYTYLRQPKRTASMKREYWMALVIIGLGAYFTYWILEVKIDDMGALMSVSFLFGGALVAVIPMMYKRFRHLWGAAILLLIASTVAPVIPENKNMQIAFVMLTCASIQFLFASSFAWQLREFEE